MAPLVKTRHDYIELSNTLNEDDEPPDLQQPLQHQELDNTSYPMGHKRSVSIHRDSMEALLEEASSLSPEEEEQHAKLKLTIMDPKNLVFQVRKLGLYAVSTYSLEYHTSFNHSPCHITQLSLQQPSPFLT
ncbi:hypothetical protein [Absidia glauca]|uniref:Uncharacterized protein n=1 Tax=Absidia glauca TaxID=4829 RepID=A0A163M9N5_ABSGL|nr:hypothetical protein [Absidia glauca]